MFDAGGEEPALGGLLEDVVDDLDGIDEAARYGVEGGFGLVIVDRDAEVFYFAGFFEVFDGAAPVVLEEPNWVPDVELLEVDLLYAEVAEAGFGGFDGVVVGEDFFDSDAGSGGPDAVLGWDLGGEPDLVAGFAGHLADQGFAVAFVVGKGGVDEVEAEVDGAIEGCEAAEIVASEPLFATNAPGSVADLTDFDSGLSELAVFHN